MIEINFEVDAEMYQDLKALAAISGVTLEEFIKEYLHDLIAERRNDIEENHGVDDFDQFLDDLDENYASAEGIIAEATRNKSKDYEGGRVLNGTTCEHSA